MLYEVITIVFSIAIGIITDVVKKGEFQKTAKERKMLYEIAKLKQHFVVCYHNDFTIQVTKHLRASHIPFVVVDPRDDLEEIAKKYHYPYYVSAEPHTEKGILKSHLSSAKGVITLADNIVITSYSIHYTKLYDLRWISLSYNRTDATVAILSAILSARVRNNFA